MRSANDADADAARFVSMPRGRRRRTTRCFLLFSFFDLSYFLGSCLIWDPERTAHMAALILVAVGVAAVPTHQRLTSQTDDVISDPIRGHEGAWVDHSSRCARRIRSKLCLITLTPQTDETMFRTRPCASCPSIMSLAAGVVISLLSIRKAASDRDSKSPRADAFRHRRRPRGTETSARKSSDRRSVHSL